MRAATATALTALLSGCLFFQPPSREATLGEALSEGTAIPASYAASNDDGTVRDDWLVRFDDPGLRAVVEEAIAHNLDLRAAAANVTIARETVTVVGAAMLPRVGVQVGASRLRDFGEPYTFHSNAEYAGVAWELDVWGRLLAQRQAAQAEYEATALDYAYARQSLAATTAKSWYLATETRQLVALAERVVEIYRRIAKLVGERRAAGKVADLDVAEVGASLNSAEATLRAAQSQDAQARRNLELLLGRYPGAEIATAPAFPPMPATAATGIPSSLLEHRPDVVAAEQRVLAAFRTQESARLALLPSFTFTLDGGRLSDGVLSLLKLNPWLLHGTLGLDLPIYEGGARLAQIQIASAEQQQAVAAYGNTVLSAFGEVEAGITDDALLADQLRFQQRAFVDRTEAVRIANIQYLAGRTDLLSVLQLMTDAIATEQQVILLHNAQLANRIDLLLAVGASFDAASAATTP
jgi:NodT family efflux transporter outer membrane factor (OMF) lipoprotein